MQLLLLVLKRLFCLRYLAIYDPNFPFFFSEIGHSVFVSIMQCRKKREPTVPQKWMFVSLSHILIISGTQKDVKLSIVSYILQLNSCVNLGSHLNSPCLSFCIWEIRLMLSSHLMRLQYS